MRRQDLEHIIRAAGAVTDEYEIVVIGSQSILGTCPNAPDELLQSMEADVFPRARPELADLVEGAIGEDSAFHARFGYYAQGVGPETALLPVGWEDRLVKVQNANTNMFVGFCLEPHDLAVSKLLAGREKDWPFVQCLLDHKIVDVQLLRERLDLTDAPEPSKQKALAWVEAQPAARDRAGEDVPRGNGGGRER